MPAGDAVPRGDGQARRPATSTIGFAAYGATSVLGDVEVVHIGRTARVEGSYLASAAPYGLQSNRWLQNSPWSAPTVIGLATADRMAPSRAGPGSSLRPSPSRRGGHRRG